MGFTEEKQKQRHEKVSKIIEVNRTKKEKSKVKILLKNRNCNLH